MINAKEAYRIAKYDNPQKELVQKALEQFMPYIERRTIDVAQKGLFSDSLTVLANPVYLKLPEALNQRSLEELVEKAADILEEQGYNIYYEKTYLNWNWQQDEE